MSKQDTPLSAEKGSLDMVTATDVDIQLTDELIVTYLQENPEFFNRHPALVTSLRLSDPHRGAISLVERQQLALRNKVQTLEEEITHLMSVANQNEQLFSLYSDLYLRLLDCESGAELLDCLHQATTELLSLKALKLWLVSPNTLEHSCIAKNDCREIIANRLNEEDYYFGRIQQSEQQLIFDERCEGSVVLIKLEHHQELIGFIAISSQDTDHFEPRMDTLLLNQFRKLVAKLLVQLQAK
ncbi:DUF484 family protein [Thalassotalea sediminis]|uniref:DUF484 family protein n=1 Tax=Thalassotalea sediminis TaxID=1759089 RepID=UPI0025729A67|nr:DUF484 family protein [Thalassotalea sediminis]